MSMIDTPNTDDGRFAGVPAETADDERFASTDAVRETAGEAWDRKVSEADEQLQRLAGETTQREWLLITRALDRTRNEIGSDTGLTLLAMLWVKEKREHGGASWDRLLDLTDAQLEAAHGYPAGERPE